MFQCKQEGGSTKNPAAAIDEPPGIEEARRERQEMAELMATQGTLGRDDVSASSGVDRSQHWWDNRRIFFVDAVGNAGPAVYEAIKGQPYFENSRLYVFTTDETMVGTAEFERVETLLSTNELSDDLIFIWVHLNSELEVLRTKKNISGNIEKQLATAPLKL